KSIARGIMEKVPGSDEHRGPVPEEEKNEERAEIAQAKSSERAVARSRPKTHKAKAGAKSVRGGRNKADKAGRVGLGRTAGRAAAADGGALIFAKETLVVTGASAAARVFRALDPACELEALRGEGDAAAPGDGVLRVRGSLRAILTGERTALNLLMRLCGIATLTRRYAQALAGTKTRLLDTRKTTPGMRMVEKAAVRAGGGMNHRGALFDGILVKDNHAAAAGGIGEAVR